VSDAGEDAAILAREREWLLGMLRDTVTERQRQDERERLLVRNARIAGIGWDEVAGALGMGAGEALERYGEPPADAEPF
jgi:hypothetical protein